MSFRANFLASFTLLLEIYIRLLRSVCRQRTSASVVISPLFVNDFVAEVACALCIVSLPGRYLRCSERPAKRSFSIGEVSTLWEVS